MRSWAAWISQVPSTLTPLGAMEETMPAFALRYISGPQLKLTVSDEHTVEAASLDEALRTRSDWPIERNWPGTCAWAKNPGTSLYHVEAWEGTLLA